MYTICPTCGTEVTFMVNQCPICSRVMNVFDFHRGDSPDIAYPHDSNAPYVYTRGVITQADDYTDYRTVSKYDSFLEEYVDEYKDEEKVRLIYQYLYHGKWYLRLESDTAEIYHKRYYLGDDVIVRFQRGDENNGYLVRGPLAGMELVSSIYRRFF